MKNLSKVESMSESEPYIHAYIRDWSKCMKSHSKQRTSWNKRINTLSLSLDFFFFIIIYTGYLIACNEFRMLLKIICQSKTGKDERKSGKKDLKSVTVSFMRCFFAGKINQRQQCIYTLKSIQRVHTQNWWAIKCLKRRKPILEYVFAAGHTWTITKIEKGIR